MPLARHVLGRVLVGALLVLGITAVSFTLTQLVPGDPVTANLGQRAQDDPDAVRAFREANGLDQPLPVQYLTYLTNLVHGDLGVAQQTRRPVATELGQYAPATLELALVAIVVSLLVGVLAGIVAAVFRDRWPDQVLRLVSLTGVSMPTFWLALVAFYLFFYRLGWAPGGGRLDPGQPAPPHVTGLYTVDALLAGDGSTAADALRHLALPALVLAAYAIGALTRFTRAAVLDVLGEDYVRAARAKGLPERLVIRRHVLRPALIAVITVAGLMFGSMLAGAVLVEYVFSWPGLGQYAYRSALNLDLPAIMGVSLVVAAIYVVVNLAVDLLYGVVDPRVRVR